MNTEAHVSWCNEAIGRLMPCNCGASAFRRAALELLEAVEAYQDGDDWNSYTNMADASRALRQVVGEGNR